jgi:hypothetical protein
MLASLGKPRAQFEGGELTYPHLKKHRRNTKGRREETRTGKPKELRETRLKGGGEGEGETT